MRQVLPMYEFASAIRNGGILGLISGGPGAIPGVTTLPMSRLLETTTVRSTTDADREAFLTLPSPLLVPGAFADGLCRVLSWNEGPGLRSDRDCFFSSADVPFSGRKGRVQNAGRP